MPISHPKTFESLAKTISSMPPHPVSPWRVEYRLQYISRVCLLVCSWILRKNLFAREYLYVSFVSFFPDIVFMNSVDITSTYWISLLDVTTVNLNMRRSKLTKSKTVPWAKQRGRQYRRHLISRGDRWALKWLKNLFAVPFAICSLSHHLQPINDERRIQSLILYLYWHWRLAIHESTPPHVGSALALSLSPI